MAWFMHTPVIDVRRLPPCVFEGLLSYVELNGQH